MSQHDTPAAAVRDPDSTAPAPVTTYVLAWTDPAVTGTPAGVAAGTALLQAVARVLGYVRANAAGGTADQLWRQALGQLPLLGGGALSTTTFTSEDLAGLEQQAAQAIASSAGAPATAGTEVARLVPGPGKTARQAAVNVVQTVVAGRTGSVVASIAQVVQHYSAQDAVLPLPHRTWTLKQSVVQLPFDYRTLMSDQRMRRQWDELMAGVDTGTVTGLPTYHRLDLSS